MFVHEVLSELISNDVRSLKTYAFVLCQIVVILITNLLLNVCLLRCYTGFLCCQKEKETKLREEKMKIAMEKIKEASVQQVWTMLCTC